MYKIGRIRRREPEGRQVDIGRKALVSVPRSGQSILLIVFILVRQGKLGMTCKLKGACHVNYLFTM